MSWETITPGDNHRHRNDPMLHVYSNLTARINAEADRRWFEDHDGVEILVDEANHRIGFKPDGEKTTDNYALSRQNSRRGPDISTRRPFQRLGLSDDDIEETQTLPLNEQDGIVVVDVSPLFEDAETVATNAPSAVATPGREARVHSGVDVDSDDRQDLLDWCHGITAGGREYQLTSSEIADALGWESGHAVGRHFTLLRKSEVDIGVEVERLEDEGKWRIAPASTADCEVSQAVHETGVETIADLGDELGIEPDRARTLAMDAGVYNQLEDRPEDGGYGRAGGDD